MTEYVVMTVIQQNREHGLHFTWVSKSELQRQKIRNGDDAETGRLEKTHFLDERWYMTIEQKFPIDFQGENDQIDRGVDDADDEQR
jgi:hypothetical protein